MMLRQVRVVVCLLFIFICADPAVNAQTPSQTDIYEHFLGTWVGSGVYMKDGVTRRTNVKIVVVETKKKDGLQLDYEYGQKGTPDFDRKTRSLKLDPAKAKFDLKWEDSLKDTYKSADLDEFAKSGLGKFTGTKKSWENGVDRVIFELSKETLRYEWQQGPDENHLVFLSIYTLNRFTAAGQP